jgi:hypothetical protein
MIVDPEREKSVKLVVNQYVRARSRQKIVVMSHALRAIRMVLPNCKLTDRELAHAIAQEAMVAGCAIDFDALSTSSPTA